MFLRWLCFPSIVAHFLSYGTPESLGKTQKDFPMPPSAACMPEKKLINLRKSSDLSTIYFPSCTRIDRCGGCCTQSEQFSCQPVEAEKLFLKIYYRKYLGGKSYSPMQVEVISVIKHKKCKCMCRKKPKDCTALQIYNESECTCECTNDDNRSKCLEDTSGAKYWDAQMCECTCQTKKDCTTGFIWNKHSCSCEPEQRRRTNYTMIYPTFNNYASDISGRDEN